VAARPAAPAMTADPARVQTTTPSIIGPSRRNSASKRGPARSCQTFVNNEGASSMAAASAGPPGGAEQSHGHSLRGSAGKRIRRPVKRSRAGRTSRQPRGAGWRANADAGAGARTRRRLPHGCARRGRRRAAESRRKPMAERGALAVIPLQDAWAERRLVVVVRRLEALPAHPRRMAEHLREKREWPPT
jgi:hypothetical protein